MSVTCGFYNSIDGDRRYNAEQLTSLVDGIIRDGVFMGIGDALMVSASTGMNVIVGTGRAWFNSTWTHNDSLLPLAVDPAEMILNRIDAVVLEVNRSMDVRENTIKMVKGTPASVPVPPTLIKSELVNQYALAHVYVGAGVTQITAANITNKVGTDDCPFVTGILQTLNLTALLAQWDGEFHGILNLRDSQFANLLSSSETQFANMINTQNSQFTNMLNTRDTEFANMISQRDSEFLAWFELIEAALDENIATNLLNMINNHKADNVSHVAYGIASGTNDKTISLSPAPSAYVDGMALAFKNVTQNTGAVTINVNGLGAKSILKSNGSALASGNLKANSVYTIRYNGSNFILQGEGGEYGNVTPDKVLAGTTFGTEDGVKAGALAPKLTNLVKNGSFENDLNCWGGSGVLETDYKKFGTKSVKLVSPDGSAKAVSQTISVIEGHKYYGSVWALRTASVTASGNLDISGVSPELDFVNTIGDSNMPLANTWYLLSGVVQAQASATGDYRVYTKSLNPIYLDGFMLIDLTDAFGEGNEPDKATMDAIVLSGNILGEDGNCEDATPTAWERWFGSDNSVVTNTKAFGSGCIKCVVTNDTRKTSGIFKTSSYSHLCMESNKYYMLSAYVKDGNTSNHKIELVLRSIDDKGDNIIGYKTASISTTGFTRIAVKGATSSNLTYSALYIRFVGDSEDVGNYFYVDGVMLNEITEDDYNNLSIEELLEKYPYTSKQAGWWDSDLTLLTADATAAADNILSGKTAYANGVKLTGTMPNNGAKIITPSTVNQIIAEGYHNGLGYVKGDSNLTPENIRKDVTIFGKTGILQPSLLGANPANVVRIDKTHVFTTIGSSETIDIITIPSGWQYIVFISDRANGDRNSSADIAAQSRFEFDSSYKSQAQVVRARLDLRNTQTNERFSIVTVSGTNRYTGFEAIENFGLFRLSDTQVYFTKMCWQTPITDGTQYVYKHWQLQDIPAAEMKLQSYAHPPDQGTCTVTNKLKGKLIYG